MIANIVINTKEQPSTTIIELVELREALKKAGYKLTPQLLINGVLEFTAEKDIKMKWRNEVTKELKL